jgi:hypothetical protein
MGVLRVNPEAEVSVGFPVLKPGVYRMRIKEVEDRSADPSNPKDDYKVTLGFADVSQLVLNDGTPYLGTIEGAGSLFDYVMQAQDKQWKLRTLTEACGLPWADYDPVVDLPGKEVDVKVKLEEYPKGSGDLKNKVDRYIIEK